MQIRDFFPFEPTESQAVVLEGLQTFLQHGMEHSMFLLRGYAGTGKSSLVGALAKMLAIMGHPLQLLAPTGRAAKVLQRYCGMPAHTIHRTIYRERASGSRVEYELGYNKDKIGTLYIIDECSMINNSSDGYGTFGSGHLLDDLTEYCFGVEGTKILLIGDDAQLPPVGTDLSPALDAQYLKGYCRELFEGVLRDIVRQEEGGEIVYLSYMLRARILDLQAGGAWQEPLLPKPDVGGEVQIISGYDLPEYLERAYHKCGEEETLLITRSNKEAEEYNKGIRYQSLFYDDEVLAGERLMVVRNNYLHQPVDAEGKPLSSFIANGEILKVLNARRDTALHGFTFREAELEDENGGFVSAYILLESLYNGAPALTPEQRQSLYDSVVLDYPYCTSKRVLMQKLRQDPFLNALQVKYAYAMTCHKAQGGQWREVFISFGYLTPEMIDLSFCRWLYTAMTRATHKLYLIDPPSFIFGSLEEEW